MLLNYLSIFLRSSQKSKLHITINILGLSFGLAIVVLISLYIYDELSFDRIHPHAERTYRLGFGSEFSNGNSNFVQTVPGVIARRLKEESPEVEQTLRVLHVAFPTNITNRVEDKSVLTDDRRWVEPVFTKVLALDLVQGNKEKFFEQPNSIVISESAARELFSDGNALGKTLTVADQNIMRNGEVDLVVTGVYRDYPDNSTFRFKYLMNLESLKPFANPDWTSLMDRAWFETYVVLREGAGVKKFETFLQSVCDDIKKEDNNLNRAFASAILIRNLHFNNATTWDYTGTVGSKTSLTILSSIAVLILVLACINYMNLATAKASQRAKEVGIRKSFGSSRAKLATQFMIESSLMVVAALLMSVVIAQLFLPRFNELARKHFTTADFFSPEILMLLLAITVFTILIGGSYPAFVLSRFKPILVLKSKSTGKQDGQWFRRTLVTTQYAVSISLTIVAIVILRQVDLMHGSKLNEQGDQIMMLRFGSVAPYHKFFALKHDLLQDPEIEYVSVGDAFPRLDHWGTANNEVTIPEINNQPLEFKQLLVDFDFMKLFNISLVAGRAFDATSPADSLSVILNETAVKSMNLTNEQVVGSTLSIKLYGDDAPNGGKVERKIIGVAKNFAYKNMRHVIEPLILYPNPNLAGYKIGTMVYVKLPKENIQEKIKFVETMWKKNLPDAGLQYYFIDDLFGRLYKSEKTVSALTLNFAVLSIAITLFGLFGLASFEAERRTKEIGVRKVHGATIWQITKLLLLNFVKIFFIAAAIAAPLDYFILDNWLTSFQYRTSLDIIVFGGCLGLLLLITVLTVGYETVKAAVANPVESLRHE